MLGNASTLWYVDTDDPVELLRAAPESDPIAAAALATQLYPEHDVRPITVGTLAGCAGPNRDEVYIGSYPGLTVVCTAEAALVHPTKLPDLLVRPLASEHTYLVSFDTEVHWGAFAHWERGEFRRSFSSTRVDILENEGLPLVWERPFWAGEHAVAQPSVSRSLPFDAADFADAANAQWLGYRYLEATDEERIDPRSLAVSGFTLYPKGAAPAPVTPAKRGWSGPRWLRRGTARQ
ncbi:DUF6928 family protein [Nocardia camponoti]|uniref:Uncharacterized protein n=1 Tax=Nocardia camponoti TaxID=1616106 RepID=A0A917QMZ0_9NOCA|nr:hypothetical protein [Nocardia camponoti]GGK58521.1 hypothetical protein GCM10011591_33410 [Nocardia camponoti]